MAKISFYLNKPDQEITSVMMNISLNGFRVQASTGIKIRSKSWDKKRNRVKASVTNSDETNVLLDDFKSKITTFCSKAQLENLILNRNDIKEYIKLLKNPNIANDKSDDLLTLYGNYIEMTKHTRAKRTNESCLAAKNKLANFQKETNTIITLSNLDEILWKKFENYLHGKGLSNNTVHRINKDIKTSLNYFASKGLLTNSSFRYYIKSSSSHKGQENKYVSLDFEEVEAIKSLIVKPHLEIPKDLFMIQIHTGIRISDLLRLRPSKIDMVNQKIYLTMEKTGDNIIIPFNSYIKSILQKYPIKFPQINTKNYNVQIKKICKYAGINKPIAYSIMRGTVKEEHVVPKYELISSHTARRTMITLALKAGMLPEEVMKISGHRNRRSFDIYVNPSREKAIESFSKVFGE